MKYITLRKIIVYFLLWMISLSLFIFIIVKLNKNDLTTITVLLFLLLSTIIFWPLIQRKINILMNPKREIKPEYIDFSIEINFEYLKKINIQEATKYLVDDYTKEWKLGEERPENRKFIGYLSGEFYNLLLLWDKEIDYIYLRNDIKLKDFIPIINPWGQHKWENRKKGTENREKLISKFSDPNYVDNEFHATIYYPFPIISFDKDHNHTALLFFEETLENWNDKSFIIRTKEICIITKIIKYIEFKDNEILFKNCKNNEKTIVRAKEFLIKYPYIITILYNCIHNELWKTKNVLTKKYDKIY